MTPFEVRYDFQRNFATYLELSEAVLRAHSYTWCVEPESQIRELFIQGNDIMAYCFVPVVQHFLACNFGQVCTHPRASSHQIYGMM